MASPAPKPPSGTPNNEALDILRRLEPMLHDIQSEQRRFGEKLANLEGRMTGIEGQLRQIPTLYQLAGLIFAILGAAFVLIRFASGH
jgi:hypothetical protein